MQIPLDSSWQEALEENLSHEHLVGIFNALEQLKLDGLVIYPERDRIFEAFRVCRYEDVKVVILGQDPYHNPGEAMGLSFSVPVGKRIPPSLRNVFKEIHDDLGLPPPNHGDLSSWARQGVLLLNSVLTVEHKSPGSHRKLGWTTWTDSVINHLSQAHAHLVFLLWGRYAQGKKKLIDDSKHLILESAHPSPLARNRFFGNHHFSQTNNYLLDHDIKPIQWKIENRKE